MLLSAEHIYLTTSSYVSFGRMALIGLLFAVLLLRSCETQGSSDVTSLFVQRGEDVHLEVTEPVQLNIKMDLFWKFNTTNTIGKLSYNNQPVLFDRYEERAEIFVQNQSLLLKNLQQNDTGNYVALVTGAKDRKVAEYNVIVQEPVSPVDLTVNSSSSDNCNFTVTCRTRGSHSSKTFRCDNRSCSEERGEETTTSINVYVDEGFIICNHSNKVSWKQDRKKVDFVCGAAPVTNEAVIVSGIIGALFAGLLVAFSICRFIRCRRKNCENTIYEVPQNTGPGQPLNRSPTEDASTSSPTSTYALVTFHTGPDQSTKTKNTTMPETVYAQVNRTSKPKSPQQPTQS
ncbi:uncharacterized protein LOC108884313 [Lates calcarifer]|uniref:Uncharacterized protein LOC108884313 n=1 Tax=Lates calcarifer TaxID=8187 RepID=A0AAJ7LX89_LATCA|nr:uncharacterized protein LOC108884313 [Lates calcarifer]